VLVEIASVLDGTAKVVHAPVEVQAVFFHEGIDCSCYAAERYKSCRGCLGVTAVFHVAPSDCRRNAGIAQPGNNLLLVYPGYFCAIHFPGPVGTPSEGVVLSEARGARSDSNLECAESVVSDDVDEAGEGKIDTALSARVTCARFRRHVM